MNYSEKLDQALVVTQEMLDASENNEWQKVSELEEARQLVFSDMGKITPQTKEELVVSKLEQLISMNQKLSDLAGAEKIACFKQFSKNKNSQKAFSSYYNV